jgi:DNA-binding transcriptional MerR regulator
MHMVPEGSIADGASATDRAAPTAVSPARSVSGLFPIRVVAQLTGINAVTVRAWERRYGLVRPERTPGGHRLYSRADVDRLRSAAGLVAQGMPISRAARLLAAPASRRHDPDDSLVARFVARSRALDDEGMSALYDSELASDPGGTMAGLLLEALPGARHESWPQTNGKLLEGRHTSTAQRGPRVSCGAPPGPRRINCSWPSSSTP